MTQLEPPEESDRVEDIAAENEAERDGGRREGADVGRFSRRPGRLLMLQIVVMLPAECCPSAHSRLIS